MSHHSHRTPWRQRVPGLHRPERYFRWRGKEISRLEGFADAVFAFAVTLLIVALEVPHTYEGLVDALRGFPAFVVSFVLLMTFWNAHYHYFRRYGLEDRFTRGVTMVILLLVLFSVYPLKFLFGAVLPFGSHHAPQIETSAQLKVIYTIYGLGFAGIWSCYAALYAHALKLREPLELNEGEVLQTRAALWRNVLSVAVCFVSIAIAQLGASPSWPGMIYGTLLPLVLWLNGRWHGQRVRAWAATRERDRGFTPR
jgi:uncharacterized membrane protein